MNRKRILFRRVALAAQLLYMAPGAWADPDFDGTPARQAIDRPGAHQARHSVSSVRERGGVIAQIDLRNITVGDALRMLTEETGLNIVASQKASDIRTALYLRNMRPLEVLDALSRAYNLWYQEDPATGVVRLYTVDEFRMGQADSVREQTEIFTLRYPNAVDVAYAIRDLYGGRVRLSLGTDQQEVMRELQSRFQRFDLIDGRREMGAGSGTGTGGANNNRQTLGQYGSGFGSSFGGGSSGAYGGGGYGAQSGVAGQNVNAAQRLDPGALYPSAQDLGTNNARDGLLAGSAAEGEAVMTHLSPIYLTVVRAQNRVLVRSRDPEAVQQVRELIQKLDVGQSTLLLEVKVLSVDLSDGFKSVFDFKATLGDVALSTLPGVQQAGSTLLASIVSKEFEARLRMAQSENRVTELATPMLQTTNQEVSRVFLGEERPIVTGYTTSNQVIGTAAGSIPVVSSQLVPVTSLRFVGTTLLLTPNINADRTVNIRVVAERSTLAGERATIPLDVGGDLQDAEVDVVTSRTYSGTVVVRDKDAIAVGGLIEERGADLSNKVPLLGDIPVLGLLFREDDRARSRRELVIILRPHIEMTPTESVEASERVLDSHGVNTGVLDEGGIDVYRPDGSGRTDGYGLNPRQAIQPLP